MHFCRCSEDHRAIPQDDFPGCIYNNAYITKIRNYYYYLKIYFLLLFKKLVLKNILNYILN